MEQIVSACIGACAPPCSRCDGVRRTLAALVPGLQIRSGLCAACAGPFVADASADRVQCELCGQTSPLATRTTPEQLTDAVLGLESDSAAALRYDPLGRPPLEPELADLRSDDPDALKWLCGAFNIARKALSGPAPDHADYRAPGASARASDAETLCVWIALRLPELSARQQRPLLARPFLEEMADHARDAGHRYLAFAALSRVAEQSGDLASAGSWLGFCTADARPLALRAAWRERQVSLALGAADLASVDQLTQDREFVPLAWVERLHLDLARVAFEEQRGDAQRASNTMRTVLETHLTSDVADALARQPALAPASRAWDRIHEQEKQKALRPVRTMLVLGCLLFVAGCLAMLLAPSVVMRCERTGVHTASCTITKNLLGLELGQRVVPDVKRAVKERAGKNTYRFALETPSGLDAADSSSTPDTELRVSIMNGFLADPTRPALTMVWDHALLLVAAAASILASLLMLGYAGIQRARLQLAPRG